MPHLAAPAPSTRKTAKTPRCLLMSDGDEFDALAHQIRTLQATVARLQATHQPAPSPFLLSWKDMTLALQDSTGRATKENRTLKTAVRKTFLLAKEMHQWVHTSFQPVPAPLSIPRRSWRHISLLADPTARKLGKHWIAEQMYQNTDRIFFEHGFPGLGDDHEDISIEFSPENGVAHLEFRSQSILKSPIAKIRQVYRELRRHELCTWLMVNGGFPVEGTTLVEETDHTALHQLVTAGGEWINLLGAEFHTHDRSVFVIQQIHQDDLCPAKAPLQRDRSLWYDLQRVDGGDASTNGVWRFRILQRMSQSFHADGFVSLEDEAKCWGLELHDCADSLKESRFRRYTLGVCDQLYNKSSDVPDQIHDTLPT